MHAPLQFIATVTRPRRQPGSLRAGMTLIEVTMVLLLLGIAAALVIPSFAPDITGQLQSAAELAAADMQYVRSLAVSNNSDYLVTVNSASNEYKISHSGANAALDVLPRTMAFHRSTDGKSYIIRLNDAPNLSVQVHVLGVESGTPAAFSSTLEFDSLGAPSLPGDAYLWLTAGKGSQQQYLAVKIHAVTGLATIEEVTSSPPASVASAAVGGG